MIFLRPYVSSIYDQPLVFIRHHLYKTTNKSSPLYNFTNKYTLVDSPIYIAGYQAQFYESRNQFYGIYPIVNSIANIGTTGDGSQTMFSGVINSQQANTTNINGQVISLLQNNVMFSSVDANGNGVALQDTPVLDINSGLPTIYGILYNPYIYNDMPYNVATNPNGYPIISAAAPYIDQPNFIPYYGSNYINYVTGQYIINFATAPGAGVTINSQSVPTNPSLPQSVLFFDGQFTVRPVPDQPYRVDMEVYVQPVELLSTGQSPELSEWWQLIAFNASKKILEDRLDYDSVNMIMPSLKEQERLVLRRTIVQQTSQRSATIYTDNVASGYGSGWQNGGGSF